MKYRISARADRDIEQICDYIARDNLAAADELDEKIHQSIQILAAFPGAGHSRTDVTDKRYLFWSIGNYMIPYRVERGRLTVVRIVHGARDLRKIFGGRVKRRRE